MFRLFLLELITHIARTHGDLGDIRGGPRGQNQLPGIGEVTNAEFGEGVGQVLRLFAAYRGHRSRRQDGSGRAEQLPAYVVRVVRPVLESG